MEGSQYCATFLPKTVQFKQQFVQSEGAIQLRISDWAYPLASSPFRVGFRNWLTRNLSNLRKLPKGLSEYNIVFSVSDTYLVYFTEEMKVLSNKQFVQTSNLN